MADFYFDSPYGRVMICDITDRMSVAPNARVWLDAFAGGSIDVDVRQGGRYKVRPAFACYVDEHAERVDASVEAYQWLVDFVCMRYNVRPHASVAKELRARLRTLARARTTRQAASGNPDGQG